MLAVQTILHPTDFSEFSKAGFDLACSLAKDYGARLILVHVFSPTEVVYGEFGAAPPIVQEEADEHRKALFSMKPEDAEINVEYFFAEGEPVPQILRLASETHCDLIVMGTHGRRGLSRVVMGSVAEQVVRKAACPVVTVRKPFDRLSVKTILHATDFSAFAEAGFHLACALARDYGAKLIVAHAAPRPEIIYGGFAASPPVPEDIEELKKKLLGIQPAGGAVATEHVFVRGEPVEEILTLAKEHNCDLIVMGTHGRTGLRRLLVGSVAEQVMRQSSCPVVTVKTPFAEGEPAAGEEFSAATAPQ